MLEVCSIKLPGRGARMLDPPFRQLVPLLSFLSDALGALADKPMAIYGHSMGALVGFELARLLSRRQLVTINHLFVSGHRAPHLPNTEPSWSTLPDDQLAQNLARLGGSPSTDLLELMLPTIRADLQICDSYCYQPADLLEAPITVFGGTHDPGVTRDELEAWSIHTRGACAVHMLPGGHFFEENSSKSLLRIVEERLIFHRDTTSVP